MNNGNIKNIMPIGKYKGMSIEEILSVDINYIDWLISQSWFEEKYDKTYNLIVNVFNPQKNECSPEHNKIQMLFLDKDFIKKFGKIIIDKSPDLKKEIDDRVKFHKELNLKEFTPKCSCLKFEENGFDVKIESNFYCNIYIEIKPSISEDFPNILRQIKRNKKIFKLNKYNIYVLLFDKYSLSNTTKEDLIKYFEIEQIRLINLNDIL